MKKSPQLDEANIEELLAKIPRLNEEIRKAVFGQQAVINSLLTGFLAGGHCLLQGVPGLAKTLLIRTLAAAVNLDFRRIQFTPDLMPSDIMGTEVLEEDHSSGKRFFNFHKGPVFTHILLADEINRTPPKTQAALLEAMQEKSVSYAGHTYKLEEPFFVLATQNPIEQAGTYPLPEAQLDRFLLFISIDYPDEEAEIAVLSNTTGNQDAAIEAVLTREEILSLRYLVREVSIHDELIRYINRLVRNSRPAGSEIDFVREWVSWGAGPRAGQAMILAAKSRALLQGRFSVTIPDIHEVVYPVMQHRILLNFKAEAQRISSSQVVETLLKNVAPPKSPLVNGNKP